MFENKYVPELDAHYSRIIASWLRKFQNPYTNPDLFRDWLKSLGLNEDQVHEIYEMATCGKLEIEARAGRFIKDFKPTSGRYPWNNEES